MNRVFQFGRPDETKDVVQGLQSGLDVQEDEWHVIENLFNPDRLEWADESVFLKTEDGMVVSLGLICKLHPCVVSYYTVPAHRRKGYGYALLRACIDRICEEKTCVQILIEPTSQSVESHIETLPDEIRRKLHIM